MLKMHFNGLIAFQVLFPMRLCKVSSSPFLRHLICSFSLSDTQYLIYMMSFEQFHSEGFSST